MSNKLVTSTSGKAPIIIEEPSYAIKASNHESLMSRPTQSLSFIEDGYWKNREAEDRETEQQPEAESTGGGGPNMWPILLFLLFLAMGSCGK